MATLDIAALRTFVTVVALSGVRRAAEVLHLSPATVSGHLRKLERELGCRLIVSHSRGVDLTSDGEELATRARLILHQHDDAVRSLEAPQPDELLVAATEYVAELLVPTAISTLERAFPGYRLRLRLTRSARVRQLADAARADIALMLNQASRDSISVASLPMQWFGTDQAPRNRLVLFEQPCALRAQAIAALGKRRHRVIQECSDLASVLTAARNHIGVTPLPRTGPAPDALHRIDTLPCLPNVTLYMAASERLTDQTKATVVGSLRRALAAGIA